MVLRWVEPSIRWVALHLRPRVWGQHGRLVDAIWRKVVGRNWWWAGSLMESNLARVWPNGRKECFWEGNLTELKLEVGHQCYHGVLKITARHLHLARDAWGLECLEVGGRKQECLPQSALQIWGSWKMTTPCFPVARYLARGFIYTVLFHSYNNLWGRYFITHISQRQKPGWERLENLTNYYN